MKVHEFVKKSGLFSKDYALSILVVVQPQDTLAQQLREVKQALVEWTELRGRKAKHIQLTVMAEESQHDECVSLLERVYEEEAVLAPLLQARQVQLGMLGLDGKPRRELEFQPG